MKTNYNLFLDDIRQPYEVGNYFNPVQFRKLFRLNEWEIVRSYDEFVKIIEEKGLPELVSFDHDLADEHYTPSEYWDDYEKSKEYQESKNYTEKTGYDCAKWLVDYCIENNKKLPKYLCHSMNPVGKDNILTYLDNYLKIESI